MTRYSKLKNHRRGASRLKFHRRPGSTTLTDILAVLGGVLAAVLVFAVVVHVVERRGVTTTTSESAPPPPQRPQPPSTPVAASSVPQAPATVERSRQRPDAVNNAPPQQQAIQKHDSLAKEIASPPLTQAGRRRAKPYGFSIREGPEAAKRFAQVVGEVQKARSTWNLPYSIEKTYAEGGPKAGDYFGPAGALDEGKSVIDLPRSPPGHVKDWTPVGNKRGFFLFWIPDGFAPYMKAGGPGTMVYVESNIPMPLRKHALVLGRYAGMGDFTNAYGEPSKFPSIQVLAIAVGNGNFDDHLTATKDADGVVHSGDGILTANQAVFGFDEDLIKQALSERK